MCPKCFGECNNCETCNDTGYVDVNFAEGTYYTRQCLNYETCGFLNGGCLNPKTIHPENCQICDSPTKWTNPDNIPEDYEEAWRTPENNHKWEIKSKDRTIERLKEKNKKLVEIVLNLAPGETSVENAQLLRVCRICKGEAKPSRELGAFKYGFGKEHAHEKCIDAIKAPNDEEVYETKNNTAIGMKPSSSHTFRKQLDPNGSGEYGWFNDIGEKLFE